jgi:hypothetical protein
MNTGNCYHARARVAAAAVIGAIVLASAAAAHPATITVSTLLDPAGPAGTCSLRQAITNANGHDQSGSAGCAAGTGNDAIAFSVTGTISLGSTLPAIAGILSITGPAAPGITIDGGGAVQVMQMNAGSTLSLRALTIANGSAGPGSNFFGGGVDNEGGTLTVDSCTFKDNQAGIAAVIDGFGGAIMNNVKGPAAGNLTVLNSTFSGNGVVGHPGASGGAIQNEATLSITNSTFTGNYEPPGTGAIFNVGKASLKGTILTASSGGNCAATAVTDVGYNISDDGSCGFSATSVNLTDPMLDSIGLQNNGGPTQTVALQSISPALDKIPPASCTDQAAMPHLLTADQRGMTRPAGPACDIGAFEVQSAAPPCTGAQLSAPRLWPPNSKFVAESIHGVTSVQITAIHQDEPVANDGTCPDATGVGTGSAGVRAERDNTGDGRVYHIQFSARNASRTSCAGEVTVCVPHDRAHRTCRDQGALYDSTICAP